MNTNLGQQTLHELGVGVDAVDDDDATAGMIASADGVIFLRHTLKL